MCVLPSPVLILPCVDTGTGVDLPFWGGAGLTCYFKRYFIYILAVHCSSVPVVTRTFLISCPFFSPVQIQDAVSEVPFVCVEKEGGLNMNDWRGDAPFLGKGTRGDGGTLASHPGAMEGSEMERKHSQGSNT